MCIRACAAVEKIIPGITLEMIALGRPYELVIALHDRSGCDGTLRLKGRECIGVGKQNGTAQTAVREPRNAITLEFHIGNLLTIFRDGRP
jgi:hypothetical protein